MVAALFIGSRYLVFSAYMKSQKLEFRQMVLDRSSTQVTQITFSASGLFRDFDGYEWKEDNKELVIDGRYHEVVAIEQSGDQFVVSIIEDTAETELFLNFFNREKRGTGTGWIALLFSLQYIAPIQYYFPVFPDPGIGHKIASCGDSPAGFYPETIKPPPFHYFLLG